MSMVKGFTFILLAVSISLLVLLACGETILYFAYDDKLKEFHEEMRQKKAKAEFNLKKETQDPFEQNDQVIRSVYTYHPFYGYTNKSHIQDVPGYNYSIDSYGYRKDFDFRKREKNVFQIGLFGGSSAFGFQVQDEETLSRLLDGMLKKKYGEQIRVKNFGVQGWHLPQQLFAFIRERQYLDAVIFFDGVNELDLYNQEINSNYPSDFPYFDARLLFQIGKNSKVVKLMRKLYSAQASYPVDSLWTRSRLFLFISMRYLGKLERKTTLAIRKSVENSEDKFPEYREAPHWDPDESFKRVLENYRKYALMEDAVAEKFDIKILHVLQPMLFVNTSPEKAAKRINKTVEELYKVQNYSFFQYHRIRRLFKELWGNDKGELGPLALDLSDAVPEDFEYKTNWIDPVHPRPPGYQMAAKKIFDKIVSAGWLAEAR